MLKGSHGVLGGAIKVGALAAVVAAGTLVPDFEVGRAREPQRPSDDVRLAAALSPAITDGAAAAQPKGASRSRQRPALADEEIKPFDKPGEAQEFYARKRAPVGGKRVPAERYLVAREQMKSMPRFSTSENREMQSIREMEKEAVARGQEPSAYVAQTLGAFTGTWSWLGPGNVGGRTRSILIDPNDPNTMYLAGVSGGVWKTTNAGSSWTALDDMMANLAVSTMAMDPSNSSIIYAGTGEGFGNIDAVVGAGIFKTTDGGATWNQLASTNSVEFIYGVNDVVVSPNDSQRVYAATWTGVWRSLDGGANWTWEYDAYSTGEFGCGDLAIRTDQSTDYIFAACGLYGFQGSIYRNSDASGIGTWNLVRTEPNMGRTSLAIAPSNQSTIYALAANIDGTSVYYNGLYAVLRSQDGGDTWFHRTDYTSTTKLNTVLLSNPRYAYYSDCAFQPPGANQFLNQGWYDNVIAVDPVDPDIVFAGGIDLFRSNDGGANWGLTSHWWSSTGATYTHADKHAIVFAPGYGTTNTTMFVGNDGGIFKTTDARASTSTNVCSTAAPTGFAWTELNNNLGITQFYHGVPYPDGATYFGGTQDNGTIRGTNASGTEAWSTILGGDGGAVAVDPLNTSILYAENTGLSIQKSTSGGSTWASAKSGISDAGFNFIAPFIMDPSTSTRLWAGGGYVWRTINSAGTWTRASTSVADLDPATQDGVSALAAAPTDGNYVLAGTGSGAIHRTAIGLTATSSTVWTFSAPEPGAYVSSVAFDPTDKNVAYATYSTFGVGHVWKSTNAGATWTLIDGAGVVGDPGHLPDIPVHSIVVDTSSRLYVGTDLGVFVSTDGGFSWAVENTGFANVVTEALVKSSNELFAFTHGRGAWKVEVTPPPPPPSLSIGDVTVTEGNSLTTNAVFTVTLSEASSNTVSVQYATANGTAAAPGDYTAATGTLTFAPGTTTRTITVPVVGDTLAEADEDFVVDLSAPVGATIADGQGLGTITNNDTGGTIQFNSATYSVSEGIASLTLTATRTGGVASGVTVQYATSDGSATAGSDYTAKSGTLTFGAGVTSQTFALTILNDTVVEGNETLNVTLSTPAGGATLGVPSAAVATILENDVGGSLKFGASAYTIAETGPAATITVSRSGGTASAVTVDFATSDGTATAASDYNATSGTLSFAAGVLSKTFTVPITNDTLDEPNETVILTLSNPTGGGALVAPSAATLTITDNDLPRDIKFSASAYTVVETGPAATITVSRSGDTASAVTVDFATSNGTATAASDYSATSGTLSFAAGVLSKTFTVPIANDTLDEPNETVILALSNPTGGGALVAPSTATLTITDNDLAGAIKFSATAYSKSENGGSATITVTRSSSTASGVTVDFATSNGTATAGSDYTTTSGTLSFNVGELSKTFTVPIIDDSIGDGNETVALTLSNPTGGATLTLPSSATLTITENEATLQFSAASYAVVEGTATATITVKRLNNLAGAVTVNYSVAEGTATSVADFTATSGTLTFASAVATRTFTVKITNDQVRESLETVLLSLSNPSSAAAIGTPSTAVLTITDNDGLLQFSAPTFTVAESTALATITVKRTGEAITTVSVDFATSDGTATAGSDYAGTTGTLIFGPSVLSKTVTVPITNDINAEPTETVNLALSNPTGGAALGSPVSAVLSITDNDPFFRFSAAAYSVAEGTAAATITVTRTSSAGIVTVDFATSDGTAASGSDYATTSGTLTFGAGVVSKTFTVPIINDTTAESVEQLNLALSNPTGGAGLGTPNVAVLNITDNDPLFKFSAAAYTVAESTASATITVARTTSVGAVAVTYATSDGSAAAGQDYSARSGVLSFAAGILSKTFTVPIINDGLGEANETINLTLSNPTGGAALGSPSAAVLTITDNDVRLKFSAASYTVAESGNATITVSRIGPTTSAVAVSFATSNGTATAGSDYNATAGTLTFAAGVVSKTFTVGVISDTIGEGNETINLALSNPTNLAGLVAPSTAVLTITDNDPYMKLSAATYTVAESGPAVTITVTRAGLTTPAVGVTYSTSDGTALAGTDYTTTSGTLTFLSGQTSKTFTVPIIDDADVDPAETFNVTLSSPTGTGAGLATPSTAVVTITDNE